MKKYRIKVRTRHKRTWRWLSTGEARLANNASQAEEFSIVNAMVTAAGMEVEGHYDEVRVVPVHKKRGGP